VASSRGPLGRGGTRGGGRGGRVGGSPPSPASARRPHAAGPGREAARQPRRAPRCLARHLPLSAPHGLVPPSPPHPPQPPSPVDDRVHQHLDGVLVRQQVDDVEGVGHDADLGERQGRQGGGGLGEGGGGREALLAGMGRRPAAMGAALAPRGRPRPLSGPAAWQLTPLLLPSACCRHCRSPPPRPAGPSWLPAAAAAAATAVAKMPASLRRIRAVDALPRPSPPRSSAAVPRS
jgi:hypothetical protein